MNDKTPDFAGVPEDMRMMPTKPVSDMKGLGQGKFKPCPWEPRDARWVSGGTWPGDREQWFIFPLCYFFAA